MRRRPLPSTLVAAVVAVVAAVVVAGCGGTAGDLLAVERSGDVPGADLQVIVGDDGMASCDGGREVRLPDALLLDAREVERALETPAEEQLSLDPEPGSILRYDVETPTGVVRFADNSAHRVDGMDELAYLVRRVAQDVCGLRR